MSIYTNGFSIGSDTSFDSWVCTARGPCNPSVRGSGSGIKVRGSLSLGVKVSPEYYHFLSNFARSFFDYERDLMISGLKLGESYTLGLLQL